MSTTPVYRFHRGIPVLVPSIEDTPIHDALAREYAQAAVTAAPTDPEGIQLVQSIHRRNQFRLDEQVAASVHRPSSVVRFLGLFT